MTLYNRIKPDKKVIPHACKHELPVIRGSVHDYWADAEIGELIQCKCGKWHECIWFECSKMWLEVFWWNTKAKRRIRRWEKWHNGG